MDSACIWSLSVSSSLGHVELLVRNGSHAVDSGRGSRAFHAPEDGNVRAAQTAQIY